MEWYYWLTALLPLVVGLVLGFLAPVRMKVQRPILKVRPPPWVFGVAWSVLYLLVGIAWTHALIQYEEMDNSTEKIGTLILYPLLLLCLYTWAFTFNTSVKWGLYHIALAVLLTLMAIFVSPMGSQLMLCPLLTWLIFATMLNYTVANS